MSTNQIDGRSFLNSHFPVCDCRPIDSHWRSLLISFTFLKIFIVTCWESPALSKTSPAKIYSFTSHHPSSFPAMMYNMGEEIYFLFQRELLHAALNESRFLSVLLFNYDRSAVCFCVCCFVQLSSLHKHPRFSQCIEYMMRPLWSIPGHICMQIPEELILF